MAPSASQSAVSGDVMYTAPLPSGRTVMVQYWLVPCSRLWAFRMSPPTMVKASSRIRS